MIPMKRILPFLALAALAVLPVRADTSLPTQADLDAVEAAAVATAAADATTKANAAQAAAVQRANHTGTQEQSTVTNLVSDLAAKETPAGAAAQIAATAVRFNAPQTLTDPQALIAPRNLRLLDHDSILQVPSKLWKLQLKLLTEKEASGGFNHNTRFRVVTLGDSVACDLGPLAQGFYGYGGVAISVSNSWIKESGAVTVTADQYARCPKGNVTTINAGTAGGTYIEAIGAVLNGYAGHANSLIVQYLASSTTGSFKAQYKLNRTGGWVDATTVTITANGGSQSAGVVNTNNGGAERFSTAFFQLPQTGFYDFRIQSVTGAGNAPVLLCNALANSGAFPVGGAIDSHNRSPGAISFDYAEGGKSLSTHFRQTTQQVWTDALGAIDPHVIVYKSLNAYVLADYQAYWNDYAQRLLTAAPQATLVVCGTHPTGSNPLRAGNAQREVDDFLRQWCAANNCVFVDVMANFPDYNTDGSLNDLNSDGVHLYGLGEHVVTRLAWQAIEPACRAAMMDWRSGKNAHRPIPGNPNAIQLGTQTSASHPLNQYFRFIGPPGVASFVGVTNAGSAFNGGTNSYNGFAGFGDDGISGDIRLMSRGGLVAQWTNNGAHFTAESGTSGTKAGQGFVFTAPRTTGRGLTIEGRTGQTPAIFAIATDATSPVDGRLMWEFFANGSYTHKGASGTTILHQQDANFKVASKGGTANAITGGFTLVAGVATINTTAAATNDHVGVTVTTPGGTMGIHYKVTISNGVSLTITAIATTGATVTTDTSSGTWAILTGRF